MIDNDTQLIWESYTHSNTVTLYHGTDVEGLEYLERRMPTYEGGLGDGIYLAKNMETAEVYGEDIYKVELNISPEQIFEITPDTFMMFENRYSSLLVGEQIQPFGFLLKGQLYIVTNYEEDLEDELNELDMEYTVIDLDEIGNEVEAAGYKALYVEGIRENSSANEEFLLFDSGLITSIKLINDEVE